MLYFEAEKENVENAGKTQGILSWSECGNPVDDNK